MLERTHDADTPARTRTRTRTHTRTHGTSVFALLDFSGTGAVSLAGFSAFIGGPPLHATAAVSGRAGESTTSSVGGQTPKTRDQGVQFSGVRNASSQTEISSLGFPFAGAGAAGYGGYGRGRVYGGGPSAASMHATLFPGGAGLGLLGLGGGYGFPRPSGAVPSAPIPVPTFAMGGGGGKEEKAAPSPVFTSSSSSATAAGPPLPTASSGPALLAHNVFQRQLQLIRQHMQRCRAQVETFRTGVVVPPGQQ